MDLKRHRKIGRLIKDILIELRSESAERISAGAPKKVLLKLNVSVEKLESVRDRLDEQLGEEFPELSNEEFLAVYYRK